MNNVYEKVGFALLALTIVAGGFAASKHDLISVSGINQIAATSLSVPSGASDGISFGSTLKLLNPTQSVFQVQGIGSGNTTSIHLTPVHNTTPTSGFNGTIAEYVLQRTSDQSFGGNYGRWSFTALGQDYNNVSGIYGEFGGTVKPTEFIFNIGYENPKGSFVSYEPMRFMAGNDLGNVAFGLDAASQRNVIQLHVKGIGTQGTRNSHAILWQGKANDGREHAVDWRAFTSVTSNSGASQFQFQNRVDGAQYSSKLAITSDGNLVVSGAGKGVILKSPNGSCFSLSVSNDGKLSTASVNCP